MHWVRTLLVMSVSVTVLELLYFWVLEISQEFDGSGKFQTYFACACVDHFCSTWAINSHLEQMRLNIYVAELFCVLYICRVSLHAARVEQTWRNSKQLFKNLKFSIGQNKIKKVRFKFQFPCLKKFGSDLTWMGTLGQFLAFLLTASHFSMVDAKKLKKLNIAIWGCFFFPFKSFHDALMLEKGKTKHSCRMSMLRN